MTFAHAQQTFSNTPRVLRPAPIKVRDRESRKAGFALSRENIASRMKTLCLILGLLGLVLADPTAYFVEKFETGMYRSIN